MASAPPPCAVCSKPCSSKLPMIACSGHCSQSFHFTCANIPLETKDILKNIPGIVWRCQLCRKASHPDDGRFDHAIERITKMISGKFMEFEEKYLSKMEAMRAEFVTSLAAASHPHNAAQSGGDNRTTYAQVTSASSSTRILVQPKAREQNTGTTKAAIIKSVDPMVNKIGLKGVKPARDGGLILGCASAADTRKLSSTLKNELSNEYIVKELHSVRPCVRIVGLTQRIDSETLIEYLRSQNDHIFVAESTCDVVKIEPLKHNALLFYVCLKVDVQTYQKLLKEQHVLIGLDGCTLYDGLTVARCYCCNQYNHIAARCPNKDNPVCSKCSGKHNSNECNINDCDFICSNCTKSNTSKGTQFDTKHAAYEYSKCSYYKSQIEKTKMLLYGEQKNK